MIVAGILCTLLGFVLAALSLGMASSVSTRLAIVLLGIAISLGGILGVINRAYVNDAIWRK